jgi:hypothetical protein
MRNEFLAVIILLGGSMLAAQTTTPTEKDTLFESTKHDFGTVPRGAQLLHRFAWKNCEKFRLEVSDLRASCGCATAVAQPRIVEPGQKGVIEVLVDAKKFVGQKTVHVQVMLTGERPQAVTLELAVHCRPDIVYNPGEVNFGVVPVGSAATQSIEIEYAGQLEWRVEELASPHAHLTARYEEMYRKPGQVGYRVHVTLNPDAPAGDFKHELQLRTNDPGTKVIPVLVQATLRPRLLITPSPVHFGTVKENQAVTRRFVVRADKPFQILRIEGLPARVTVSKPSAPALVQTVSVTWTPEVATELNAELTLVTDLDAHGTSKVLIHGQAVP